jgi:hypothetical protein
MDDIYYDITHPASFSGVNKLRKAAKVSRKDAEDYLQRQNVYTMHKQARRIYPRRRIISLHPLDLFQFDLCDFQSYSRWNKGYKYVLVCKDCFTKRVWYIPLKSKRGPEVATAFRRIFKDGIPRLASSDAGTEFFNKPVQDLFKKHKIKHYITHSGVKASIAERQIRKLRQDVVRWIYHTGNRRYFDILPHLQDSYNNTPHTVTKIAPSRVAPEDHAVILQRLNAKQEAVRVKFEVGDYVRILLTRGIFDKEAQAKWSSEIFRIIRIGLTNPPVYYLEDLKGEPITGGFYTEELVKCIKDEQTLYDIEKVLKKRRNKDGTYSYYVKFYGYPTPEWVNKLVKKSK